MKQIETKLVATVRQFIRKYFDLVLTSYYYYDYNYLITISLSGMENVDSTVYLYKLNTCKSHVNLLQFVQEYHKTIFATINK